MKITKCDKCKKIKRENRNLENKWISGWIDIRNLSFHTFDFCEKCGKPLIKYFKKYLKIKTKK